mmetsp:Transcript_30897/g.49854  ORF Transcript_30897/g.49854 Transcript_30897/m.49854 type:complete len:611 (-) Transcript_30897:408-2240(-)
MSLELFCALFPLLDRSIIEEHLEQALPLGDVTGGALYWQLSELERHQMRGQPEAAAAAHVEPSYVEDVCVVCMDKDASMRVVPCGHQCLCKECSDKLGRHSLCPMCRRRIAEFESHSIVLANSANSHLPAQASREPEPLPPRIPPVQPASAAADPRQDERRPIVQGQSTSLVVCLLCVMVFTGLRLYSVILACGPGTESVVGAWPRHAKLAVLLAAGTCVPCPAQHFRRDGLWCQKCPVRQVSNSGSAACATPGAETCPKGKYDNALSQGCIDCGAGYFKALAGSGMCVSCPINTFAAVPASSKCTPCRRGQVSEEGSTICTLCAAGTYSGTSGICEPCLQGSWSEEGSNTCTCNKGWTAGASTHTHISPTEMLNCTKCPANTFKAVRGRQECQACPFELSSPEASEDLMDCVPETAWLAATSALSVILKSTGVFEEDARERRWRRQYTHTSVQHLNAQLQHFSSIVTDTSDLIYTSFHTSFHQVLSQLHTCIEDLFGSASAFYAATLKHAASSTSAAICHSPQTLKLWLTNQEEYNVWRRAVSAVRNAPSRDMQTVCGAVKRSARKVLLLLHPDRFERMHPACHKGASDVIAKDFNNEYQVQKDLCARK